MATATLPAIVKTDMAPGLRYGGATVTRHRECWQAETTDRIWRMNRLDGVPGTPWEITHKPTDTELGEWFTSLTRCRRFIGSGGAQAALERIQAHKRGEHTERQPMCREC